MKKFSIFLIVGTVLIEAGLISGLLTEYWITSQDFHLGVLRHSYYTQNATRIDHVDSILSDLFESTTGESRTLWNMFLSNQGSVTKSKHAVWLKMLVTILTKRYFETILYIENEAVSAKLCHLQYAYKGIVSLFYFYPDKNF